MSTENTARTTDTNKLRDVTGNTNTEQQSPVRGLAERIAEVATSAGTPNFQSDLKDFDQYLREKAVIRYQYQGQNLKRVAAEAATYAGVFCGIYAITIVTLHLLTGKSGS